jgi:uncharacterized protein YuzE
MADAVYVRFADAPVARSWEIDSQRIIDYDESGAIVWIEFLGLRRGVDLRNMPHPDELTRYFGEHQIAVLRQN